MWGLKDLYQKKICRVALSLTAFTLTAREALPHTFSRPLGEALLCPETPDLPTAGFRPLQQIVDRALSARRFFVNLLAAFAAAALALAAIGIYGVIAYSVTRRLTLAGVAIGTPGALALSSLVATLLYGVSPSDPWTYAGSAAILLLVALAAGFIPAFRASRISPISALRAD